MLQHHEYASIFPMMSDSELDALAADVKARGLRQRITLYQGKILDGRSRYEACARTGVDPVFATYDGDDPLGEVLSLNLRRNLNESQRAMVAAGLATLGQGARTDIAQYCAKSQDEAAELLNVSRRSVQHATTVRHRGSADLQRAVETGKVTVSLAAKISATDVVTQDAVIRHVERGVKPLEAFRIEKAAKIHERLLRNPTGKFHVIYADAPWSYGEHGNQPGSQSRERDHYPVMELSEICALPVKDWAEENAVLFLWTPSPMLKKAFEVIDAWGFEYKASFVWDKVDHNMGHYNSVRHEFLLVCTKGQCQPDVRKLFDSVVTEPRTQHSRKPAKFYDIIETLYPNGRRLELFCRGSGREGLADVWTGSLR
jgi:N6-adenosine-specific RNA methylase IME4